ncbi:MAG: hypothetical protein R3D60_07665 [Paracoccaceae bacterium]
MLVILLKFLEVGSRAVFIVLTSYSLDIEQAGQFGLVVTLQGLASFAIGYERHIDVMRKQAGQPPDRFDTAVAQAITMYVANSGWAVPIFVIALVLMAHLPPVLIALCVVIAISEQIMNIAYHMAMVEPRYRKMLAVTVVKNIVIAGVVVVAAIAGTIDLPDVLKAWAIASAAGVGVIAVFWFGLSRAQADPLPLRSVLETQYRASWTHFILGLTAVITIQIDRLLVGAVLTLEDAGIYFRHVLLVSMLYQVFNIAFHNRILPNVFVQGQQGRVEPLLPIVRREYWNVLAFWVLSAIGGIVLDRLTGGYLLQRYNLEPLYFVGLLLASALRARADLNALVFNALHHERTIFRLQLTSFALSLPVLTAMSMLYGIPGLIAATGIAALIYLTLSTLRLVRLKSVTHNAV